jgi:hypothetical protein
MVEYDVTAGQYDVSESALSGWDMTGNTCVDVAVANGETKHCTITNTKRGHIIVDKVTYPAQSSQSFSFTAGGAGYSSFSLTDAAAPNDQEVVPGKYSVAETVPSGWAQTNAVCDSGETIADLDVEPGETVTCTFTNVKPDAKITLTPLTATNEVDDDHEVTATVLVDSGAGFVNAPNGTLMTFSFSQNTAGAAFVGGSTCNTSAGSCTITINSTSAGIVALHAATDVTPLGVALHRETDSTGGNSGDAYKTYVDASIALSPQTGTNEVGDEHEITATVTRNDGTGSSPAVGETVTFKVTTGTADFVGGVDTCVTDASGTCSIEIVDTGAGQNTIDAQVTVSVGGLELERATDADAGPDGSDEAAKTYVDARISIGDSATNNVNEPHTFTVFVEENDGEGWDPAEGEKVNFTLVSNTAGADFTGDDFCTTGVDGKCTVTINSATPGTVDVHAESGVEVGGLTLDRETDGQGGNSDDATKTYEAGKIIVKKITVGGDGDFTFTADYDANGFVLSNGEEDNSGWIATGTHSVSETVPEGWDLTSTVCESSAGGTEVASSISLQNDETVTCTFTNTKRAKIIIVKDAIPNDAQNFAFSGTLGAFTLDDDSGVVDPSDPLDEYENSKVFTNVVPGSMTVTETQPNQYWELADAACVVSGTSEAVSSNLVGGTLTLTLTPGADVTCTFVNEKLVPTRTQGFWSTHTAFTNSVFAEKFPDGMKIGDGIVHKGYITNVLSPKASSELYGAWYSNIAKKTDGKQRTALDKARMQLLQQLVTAKLNCAQFGCTASVQTMIANADTAYAGASVAAIIAAAGQLDQFNNSGDSLIVGNVGKATPKESKNLANLLFWNNP